MTLTEGKRRGAARVDHGWLLVIPAFTQQDGSQQPPSRVFWPDDGPRLPVT